MSEFLQSGLHPDADQLNAFVEHALPAHEREQTLAHLAVCPTCRAVVSLSLPPAEVHIPQPARRPWFSGWNIVWPIAAAFATLIPVLLYVHQTTTPSRIAAPPEVAESHAPAPPTNPAFPPPAAAKPPSPPAAMPKPTVPSPVPVARTASAPAPAAAPAAASRAIPGANPHQQVPTTDAKLGSPIENEQYAQLPLSMNGGPRDPSAFQYVVPGGQEKPAAAAGRGAGNGNSGIYGGTGQTNLNENYVEGMPVTNIARQGSSNPAADSGGAGSMDAVTQALALADATAASDDAIESPASFAPLPSGLPTLSTASSGRRTVALDTSNTLFLSYDGGRRWRQVSSPWRGRAVKVELVAAPLSQLHGYAIGAESGSGGARAGAGAALAHSATSGGIQGTITDPSGSVVPGAQITATNTDTGVQTIRRTAADGTYSMQPLPAGPYNVEVVARGFQRLLQENVTVDNASMAGLNLKLAVGAANETITVTDAPAHLDTTDATSGATIATATPGAPAAAKAAAAPAAAAAPPTLRAAARAPAPPVPPPSAAASSAAISSTPLFVITTESGDRWTSPDGQAWTRR